MQIGKKGIRALGIAESFSSGHRSTLAGVVMRKDLQIDGIKFSFVTIGGMDATDVIINMVQGMQRRDINMIMLSGCIIAWYNIIDPDRVYHETNLPVVCVTYEDSEGLESDLAFHFPDDEMRRSAYHRLGARTKVHLHTDYDIFIRCSGISFHEAELLCNAFTSDGKIPEPLRVARLCARAVMQYMNTAI
jgi:endonuclease V-like protein UPF0215 family